MLGEIEQQIDTSIGMGKEHALQGDHIDMLQFS